MDGEEPAFLKAFKARVGYQETDPEEEMKVRAYYYLCCRCIRFKITVFSLHA